MPLSTPSRGTWLLSKKRRDRAAPPPDAARPIPLFWEIDGALQARVDAAAAAYDAHVGRLDVAAFATADGGGMAWAKAHGVGLDALFQLALQLAYWRLVGRMDSVYEACSTQAFVHGRTEVVRSATAPSRALVAALGGGGAAPPPAEAGRLQHAGARLADGAAASCRSLATAAGSGCRRR